MDVEPILRGAEQALGAALGAVTLLDVFDTVVIPGSLLGWLKGAQRVRRVSLPFWRWRASRRDGPLRMSRGLAPFILLATFTLWMGLLLLAFALMDDGLRASFRPALTSFPDAVYAAGLTLVTTGLSGREAEGMARWVALLSGFSGLAVMTMAVTYILQVQTGLQRRDALLSKLTTTAGRPPTGLALLETHAALGSPAELDALFREWRDWTASVLHSHTAHPVLAYFRSISSEIDWPLAVGIVLDAASIHAALIDGHESGAALLLHRDGARLTASLVRLFGLDEATAPELEQKTVDDLLERLSASGYAVRRGHAAFERLRSLRGDYAGRLAALADHFGVAGISLLERHERYVSDYRD